MIKHPSEFRGLPDGTRLTDAKGETVTILHGHLFWGDEEWGNLPSATHRQRYPFTVIDKP